MSQKTNQNQALLEVWDVLLRFRWRFIVPAFLVMAAVLVASLLVPRKYKAECTFERRTDVVLSEIMSRGTSSFQDPRQSLSEEISGEPAIDQLFTSLKTLRDPQVARVLTGLDRDSLRALVGRKITVGYDISSNELDRVRVSYIADNPDFARAVVNTLVSNYMERTKARLDARLKEGSSFFQKEVNRSRAALDDLETRKLTYEIEHASLLPENPNNVQTLTTEAQSSLTAIQQQREAAAARAATLRQSLDNTPDTIPTVLMGRNPELTRLETHLRELQSQLAQSVGPLKMTDKHPELIALKQQIADTESEIQAAPAEVVVQRQVGPNPKHAELEMRLANATTEVQTLEHQAGEQQNRVNLLTDQSGRLFQVRAEYQKIAREIEDGQRQLAFWDDNLRRVSMAQTAETGQRGIQMSFLKPCEPISKPVSPNLLQTLLAAAALGVMAGGVSVFFAHRADQTCAEGDRLAEACNLKLLGSVSSIISRRQRRLQRIKRYALYPANLLAMVVVLTALTTILYLNLEKPELFAQFRKNPARLFRPQPHVTSVQAASPSQE